MMNAFPLSHDQTRRPRYSSNSRAFPAGPRFHAGRVAHASAAARFRRCFGFSVDPVVHAPRQMLVSRMLPGSGGV